MLTIFAESGGGLEGLDDGGGGYNPKRKGV
jgi:hypothetical protein